MPEKPSYLGLLNAISLGEAGAHRYLKAWAETTSDADVRGVIQTVAIREGEHALAFEKRICELGYTLREREDKGLEKRMQIARSDRSDLEKFEALGVGGSEGGEDPFGRMFEDTSIDIQTGELLGRYIAEERDSGRRLRACYQELKSRNGQGTSELAELRECLEEMTGTLSSLANDVKKLRKA
jgi:hypothetical protein